MSHEGEGQPFVCLRQLTKSVVPVSFLFLGRECVFFADVVLATIAKTLYAKTAI